jgi:membrane protease YdiL (CAAX protease family)
MNINQSSTQVVEAPAAEQTAGAKLTTRTKLAALAWGLILLVSIPQIIYRLFVPALPGDPVTPYWLALVQVAVLTLLLAVTWVWPTVKPLRGFILALIAYLVGVSLIIPFIGASTAWSEWKQGASWGVRLVASTLEMHLVLIVLMTLTLIGSGIGRRELFLVRGNPSAPAQPTRLLAGGSGKESVPWNRVARNFLLIFIIISGVVLWVQLRPDLSQISQALIFLPAIIIAAAINAFGEEFEFRSVPLARLAPVFGPGQAILMAAALFGLMHYFGNPGGLPGVLMAGYLGWWAAKSMIDTRGFVWAFSLHFLGDIIVYAFWAMSI